MSHRFFNETKSSSANLLSNKPQPSSRSLPRDPHQSQNSLVVVVDGSLKDYQLLVTGAVADADVFVIDPSRDGIAQITQFLHPYRRVSNLHIISYGAPGCLSLGSTQLSLQTLDRYAWELQGWFSTCTPAPQLLLYGCSIAWGETGAEFIDRLRQLTGAVIAASTTSIGNTQLGGNWQLDYTTGAIVPSVALLPDTIDRYQGIFADRSGAHLKQS
jgi:large repetitive protein